MPGRNGSREGGGGDGDLGDLGDKPASPELIDGLRERMALIQHRPRERAAAQPLVHRDLGNLPFERSHTPSGIVHVRRHVYAVDARVGDLSLAAAKTADQRQLSLLSADPRLATCHPGRALFLDVETTSVRGSGHVAFLVGLAWFEEESLVLEQFLLLDVAEERALLDRVAARVDAASFLVTFNGKSFDVPLLASRPHGALAKALAQAHHLDLLPVARRVHGKRYESCRLGSLERHVLHFEREDDVVSFQVGACYRHFLRTGEEDALRAVVTHNEWDVVSMVALVGVYGEPFATTRLLPEDLVEVARSLRRFGELEEAESVAERAVRAGVVSARKVRGQVAKARGDKTHAVSEFELYLEEVSDPVVRLDLAKLYEHFARMPDEALRVVDQGTTEAEPAAAKRRARLKRKLGTTDEA